MFVKEVLVSQVTEAQDHVIRKFGGQGVYCSRPTVNHLITYSLGLLLYEVLNPQLYGRLIHFLASASIAGCCWHGRFEVWTCLQQISISPQGRKDTGRNPLTIHKLSLGITNHFPVKAFGFNLHNFIKFHSFYSLQNHLQGKQHWL